MKNKIILSVSKSYVQKSTMFMYPLLGIARGHSSTPLGTYFSWKGKYNVSDRKFMCVYYTREDQDFRLLENVKLLKNPLFDDFVKLDDTKGLYVFDFSSKAQTFDAIANGEYSKILYEDKKKILGFFRNNKTHHIYMDSYLNPSQYFDMYAENLCVNSEDIKEMKKLLANVGELCSKPKLDKETFDFSLESQESSLNLQR